MSVTTITPVETGTLTTDHDTDHSETGEDWYCVKTDDWPCVTCGQVCKFITAMHLIILWPAKDDPAILKHAGFAKRYNRNPQILKYKDNFGPAITYYEWSRSGNKVCSIREK